MGGIRVFVAGAGAVLPGLRFGEPLGSARTCSDAVAPAGPWGSRLGRMWRGPPRRLLVRSFAGLRQGRLLGVGPCGWARGGRTGFPVGAGPFGVVGAWGGTALEGGGVVREGPGRYGVPTPRTGRLKFPVVLVAGGAGVLRAGFPEAGRGEGANPRSVGSLLVQRAPT